MPPTWMIYGATGYSGELVARRAKALGLDPLLAGRKREPLVRLASELGLAWRHFPLDSPDLVGRHLDDVNLVLHCAGPFRHTYHPMVEACLARHVHYLDITGEIPVFEAIASRDAAARRAGVLLLPGVGFDVVPSDCLAAHLHRRLPTADRLALGFALSGGASRGTLRTSLDQGDGGSAVRRAGLLTPIRLGSLRRTIDFGSGPRPALAIPWGDLATAWRSTRIPNIETYMGVSTGLLLHPALLAAGRRLLRTTAVRRRLATWIEQRSPGPDAAARSRGRSRLWGEARDADGNVVVSRLVAPEGYTLTAETALRIIERTLSGQIRPGFQTPSSLFGPDFVLEIYGVSRTDE